MNIITLMIFSKLNMPATVTFYVSFPSVSSIIREWQGHID